MPLALAFVALLAPHGALAVPSAEVVRFRLLNESLAQAERPSPDWDPSQRDCAGFVRFLYRKATGRPGPLWRRGDGDLVHFVSAAELVAFNFTPTVREPQRDAVETGDLLAFFDPEKHRTEAWHLMVLLRPPGTAPARLLAIYHNGASGRDAAVRKVWLDELLEGPPEWRPVSSNPRFIGTLRWTGW